MTPASSRASPRELSSAASPAPPAPSSRSAASTHGQTLCFFCSNSGRKAVTGPSARGPRLWEGASTATSATRVIRATDGVVGAPLTSAASLGASSPLTFGGSPMMATGWGVDRSSGSGASRGAWTTASGASSSWV